MLNYIQLYQKPYFAFNPKYLQLNKYPNSLMDLNLNNLLSPIYQVFINQITYFNRSDWYHCKPRNVLLFLNDSAYQPLITGFLASRNYSVSASKYVSSECSSTPYFAHDSLQRVRGHIYEDKQISKPGLTLQARNEFLDC